MPKANLCDEPSYDGLSFGSLSKPSTSLDQSYQNKIPLFKPNMKKHPWLFPHNGSWPQSSFPQMFNLKDKIQFYTC